jgi:hypothetical protein
MRLVQCFTCFDVQVLALAAVFRLLLLVTGRAVVRHGCCWGISRVVAAGAEVTIGCQRVEGRERGPSGGYLYIVRQEL